MLEKIKRSKAAVSTMVLVVVAILGVTVAAAGIYFFVLSDDGKEEWHGLDFSDPMIQGTLGVGTEYTYSCSMDGEYIGELTITIIGQSGSYYAYEIKQIGGVRSDIVYGMIHKETGKLRFSESEGTDGEYEGKPLTKWKLNLRDVIETDKTGTKDIVKKEKMDIVFLSNSNSILPYKCYLYYNEETNGRKTSNSYIYEAVLISKYSRGPVEYEMSKYIGDRIGYSILFKEDDKTIGHCKQYYRVAGEVYFDEYLGIEIYDGANDKKSGKIRTLEYYITSYGSPSSYDGYAKGPDITISTNWGEKNCEYYYYEYYFEGIVLANENSYTYREEAYVGKDDGRPYLTKTTHIYPDYTESTEYVLEEYVIS